MKILITGANGFVGSHLCLKLLEQGHTVYGLVRTPSKMTLRNANFILIHGDLGSNNLAWTQYLPTDLNACIHTAGLVHSFNTADFFKINKLGTQYLIEALKLKFNQNFKFILLSSLAAAGPANLGESVDESGLDFPVSAYGKSKKEAEVALKSLAPKTWITSIIRPPMIIGPGDTAVLDIFKMVKQGIIILPGIDSKIKEYSFVCVFDLTETISILIQSDQSLFLYSSFDKVIKFHELISEIKKHLRKRWSLYLPIPFLVIKTIAWLLNALHKFIPHQLRLTPDKILELKALAWTCDSTKSRVVLGQKYQFDLSRTIAITLADYQKRHWL